jgi:uncharacterized protein (DUF1330 family)
MARAFFIGQFEIHDPQGYAAYRAQTAATLADFGGRFVVRGGRLQVFEGEAPLSRVVVIEFPSFDQAKAWYDSAAYQKLIPIRQKSASGRSFLVEGAEE